MSDIRDYFPSKPAQRGDISFAPRTDLSGTSPSRPPWWRRMRARERVARHLYRIAYRLDPHPVDVADGEW